MHLRRLRYKLVVSRHMLYCYNWRWCEEIVENIVEKSRIIYRQAGSLGGFSLHFMTEVLRVKNFSSHLHFYIHSRRVWIILPCHSIKREILHQLKSNKRIQKEVLDVLYWKVGKGAKFTSSQSKRGKEVTQKTRFRPAGREPLWAAGSDLRQGFGKGGGWERGWHACVMFSHQNCLTPSGRLCRAGGTGRQAGRKSGGEARSHWVERNRSHRQSASAFPAANIAAFHLQSEKGETSSSSSSGICSTDLFCKRKWKKLVLARDRPCFSDLKPALGNKAKGLAQHVLSSVMGVAETGLLIPLDITPTAPGSIWTHVAARLMPANGFVIQIEGVVKRWGMRRE